MTRGVTSLSMDPFSAISCRRAQQFYPGIILDIHAIIC